MNSFGVEGGQPETAEKNIIGSPDNIDIYFSTFKYIAANNYPGYINKYNINTNQVSIVSTLPEELNISTSGVRYSIFCNNSIYCIVTATHSGSLPDFRRTWKYDIFNDTWTRLSDPPSIGLYYRPQFIVLPENKIIMIGGASSHPGDYSNIFHRYIFIFDTVTNTWTRKTDRPFFSYATVGKYCPSDNLVWTYSYNGEGYPFDRIDTYNYINESWNLIQPNADREISMVDYYGDLYYMHSTGGVDRQWALFNKNTQSRITKQICPYNASHDQVTCGRHIYALGKNQIWRYGC